MPWKGERVFMTGATGFIGSWLAGELRRRGARVTALVRPGGPRRKFPAGVRTALGAVENLRALSAALRAARPRIVFHLASTNANFGADASPLEAFETNVRGTYNLLEACRLAGTPVKAVVVTSSQEVLEDPALGPGGKSARHPYEVSKRCVAAICRAYQDTYGLPAVCVLCPNVYGGGDLNFNRLVPGTIRRVLSGRAPVIRSDGSHLRSFVYAPDLVEALLLAAAARARGALEAETSPLTFAGPPPVRVLEMVARITRLAGASGLAPRIANTSPGERSARPRATGPTLETLGWTPRHTLEEGLRQTLAWYRERRRPLRGKRR